MPTPSKGESQKDFVSRCIPIRQKEHPDEDPKQSAAVCNSMYREAHKAKALIMKMTKVQKLDNGRVRWQARANTGEFDVYQERLAEDLFDDVVANFYRVTEAVSRGESPPDEMTRPILDISHYSLYIPKAMRDQARCGWLVKMWRDGRALFAQGYFDNSRLGQLAAKAALNAPPEDRRVSVVVYPDYTLVKTDNERKTYHGEGGVGTAWLDSLAMTAHPADPGAVMEVKSMTKVKDDAEKVLGEEAADIIKDLEAARVLSTTAPEGAVIKTEVEVEVEVENESDEEAPEVEAPKAETPVALTPADLAEAFNKMLPGIGSAIDQRLQPLAEQVATLEAQVKSLAAEEAAKVKAVLDGGSLFDRMWSDKNSVQRRKTVTDTGPEEAKGTAAMSFAARYGPDGG